MTQEPESQSEVAASRMKNVADQILSGRAHRMGKVLCPYCGHWNFLRTRTFCCNTLRDALIAVLSGERMLKTAEAAEREMNN
jgi:hypothetical protein